MRSASCKRREIVVRKKSSSGARKKSSSVRSSVRASPEDEPVDDIGQDDIENFDGEVTPESEPDDDVGQDDIENFDGEVTLIEERWRGIAAREEVTPLPLPRRALDPSSGSCTTGGIATELLRLGGDATSRLKELKGSDPRPAAL